MKPFKQVLEWYRNHQTASQLGFDPDGMCLKICRTAHGKDAVYPSAVEAQRATPEKYRVHKVSDLRKGMVIYYDHPSDSNPFGHIVTIIGRVKGADRNSLHDVLVETNSVKANEVVVVRGDYFPKHWGDPFIFGATWLNGSEIDYAGRSKPTPPPPPPPPPAPPEPTRGEKVDDALQELRQSKYGDGGRGDKIRAAIAALKKIPFLNRKG